MCFLAHKMATKGRGHATLLEIQVCDFIFRKSFELLDEALF